MSTSFEVDPGSVDFSATAMGPDTPLFYARWQSPTVRECEQALAELEGTEAALCFASGMAAITGVMLHVLSAGDHLVLPEVCYAGVAEFARDTLSRFGIEVTRADTTDLDAVARSIRHNTKLVHIETPCNPTLALADVAAIGRLARKAGAQLSVDGTIASPIATRAIELGADYSIHSLTKYLSGHGDVLGGVVSGTSEAIDALRKDVGIHLGASLHPMSAWLTLRSLPTLRARMALHEANAVRVADFLATHPNVDRVNYPGLASHPQRSLAERQMATTSGLLSFSTVTSPERVLGRLQDARTITHAISLGKAHTLLFYLPTEALQQNAYRLDPNGLARLRKQVGDGVFRLSVGLEDADAIIADLETLLA